jgi:paraquat-inducible protein B
MPEVLIARNWDCAEAVELNRWTSEFLTRRKQFAALDVKIAKPLDDLFRSIAAIRHTAVHRLRISAKSIEQYLLDAESLLTLLDDQVNLVIVGRLRRETQSIIGELERNKHILNTKREKTQQRIAAQRAELDRLEKALFANMVKEDSDYQALAGANLEQATMMVDMNSTNAICNGGMDVDVGDNESVDDFEDSCSEILT